MKTYEEVAAKLHTLLTSILDGGEWSASFFGRFTSVNKSTFLTELYNNEDWNYLELNEPYKILTEYQATPQSPSSV
jgi:hypothetical protein